MRVIMISGSWPPTPCGVGHYASVLADNLDKSIEVIRYGSPIDFKPLSFLRVLADIRRLEPDIIHVQYPTVGYRRSLLPSLLAMASGIPSVVTIHEYSIFRWYRAPWFLPFNFSDALIFTSGRERIAFEKVFGTRRRETSVITIGSNIPSGSDMTRESATVGYFGLLMPNKGIEDFLALANAVSGIGFKPIMIGSIPDGFYDYGAALIEECHRRKIVLHLDKSDNEVANLLQRLSFAYLPFPDGASEKRGSLLAALVNKVVVLTPHQTATPDWIRKATICVGSPEEAARCLIELKSRDDGGCGLVDFDVAKSKVGWRGIAEDHLRVYEAVFCNRSL